MWPWASARTTTSGDLAVDYPNNETVALRLEATKAPLNDIRVRQAVNYAIDKEGIVNSLYQGKHKVAAQLVPEGIVGHNSALKGWAFDLDKAKSLVAEAKADGVDTSRSDLTRGPQRTVPEDHRTRAGPPGAVEPGRTEREAEDA